METLKHSGGFSINVLERFSRSDLILVEILNGNNQPSEYAVSRGLKEYNNGWSWDHAVGYCQTKEQGYRLFASAVSEDMNLDNIALAMEQVFYDEKHYGKSGGIIDISNRLVSLVSKHDPKKIEDFYPITTAVQEREHLNSIYSYIYYDEGIEFDETKLNEVQECYINAIYDSAFKLYSKYDYDFSDAINEVVGEKVYLDWLSKDVEKKCESYPSLEEVFTGKETKPSLVKELTEKQSEVKREGNERSKTVSKER